MNISLLSLVDRFTQKLGPISSTIDAVIGHIVPQKTASACSGVVCYTECVGIHKIAFHYAPTAHWCAQGVVTCTAVFFDDQDC